MNNIIVNFENLTENERNQLMELVEKSQKKPSDFDIKKGDEYYTIDETGCVYSYTYCSDDADNRLTKFGNASKNKAYMEKRVKEIKLYNLLSNFAWDLYDGEAFSEEEWKNEDIKKWHINFGCCRCKYNATYGYTSKKINTVYFRSREIAQRAIDEIIKPFMVENPSFVW